MEHQNNIYGSAKLPWRIRHVNTIMALLILLTILWIFFFLSSITYLYTILVLSIVPVLIITSVLYSIYTSAKRFAEVVSALNMELIDVKFVNWSTLKVSTVTQDEFFLHYHPGDKHSNPHYKVWIATTKKPPSLEGGHAAIWHKPSISEKLQNKEDIEYPEYLSPWRLEEIKSLYSMWFDTISSNTTINALLKDKWLYSETQDLLRTLEVLRDIKQSL